LARVSALKPQIFQSHYASNGVEGRGSQKLARKMHDALASVKEPLLITLMHKEMTRSNLLLHAAHPTRQARGCQGHLQRDPTVASKRVRSLPPPSRHTQGEGVVSELAPRGDSGCLLGGRGSSLGPPRVRFVGGPLRRVAQGARTRGLSLRTLSDPRRIRP
jgi:hypothetical protein